MNTQTLEKEMTIDEFARIFLKSISEIEERLIASMATKEDVARLEKKVDNMSYHQEKEMGRLQDKTQKLKHVIEQDLNTEVAW